MTEDKQNEQEEQIVGEEVVNENVQTNIDPQQQQIDELQTRLKRLQADFDNFKRRSKSEAEQLSLFVSVNIAAKLLPVLDNFERALACDNTDEQDLKKGMDLIYRQLEKALHDMGVEKIPSMGEQFSPELHEALMNAQNPDLPDGQIDMVFEQGYKIKDKVVRYSKVRVINNC